ncbi:hypothetical protein EIP86_005528 [Pleurotus ostreatoroseus]|nr:hypothetical protein EIP86_005528 [Pleurotus ostreatoroseus]
MRFFAPLLSLAAVFGAVAAQEAARFGSVDVSPSSVRFDQPITIHYNSSTARTKPVAVDFYLQGTYANGFVLPEYPLGTMNDIQNVSYITFQRNLPVLYASPTNGYQANTSFLVWAILTYPESTSGALQRGGTSAGLAVTLD